ncbi:hypothetical protein L0244_34900, partial [bacterium]|nr:hypothetical protein [bacterium]
SVKRLTKSEKEISNLDPSFSPDGKEIIYTRSGPSGKQLYIMKVDGSSNRRLTQNKFSDEAPIFSADGRTVYFARAERHRPTSTLGSTWDNWDIYALQQDGSGEKKVTESNYYLLCCLSYSHANGTVVFGAIAQSYPPVTGIYSVQANGSEPPIAIREQDGMANLHPVLSPDGKKIAFVSRGVVPGFEGEFQIFLMDSNGQNVRQLTRDRSRNSFPAFTLDGEKLIFLSCLEYGDECKVNQIRLDGSSRTEISIF